MEACFVCVWVGLLKILGLSDCPVSTREPMLMTALSAESLRYELCLLPLHLSLSLPPSLPHQHKCYLVATCDRDLKRRLRKIPGVPIMYISQHRYSVEQMPDDYGGLFLPLF